ncbi:MAG: Rieske 2Fe-2S domain-containing protein [Dehalococcoidales bacterium]|nr:Rieske 2Fe-2S domain-containing protein [Dehalococcoidales bacterium]
MGNFMPVAKTGELANGAMKEVTVQGRNMLLARVGDRYYAADGRCPHMGEVLSQGKLEGTVVTCPRHGSQFDLTDGHVVRWLKGSGLISAIGKTLKSPRPLTVYQVKVEKDDILVEV